MNNDSTHLMTLPKKRGSGAYHLFYTNNTMVAYYLAKKRARASTDTYYLSKNIPVTKEFNFSSKVGIGGFLHTVH